MQLNVSGHDTSMSAYSRRPVTDRLLTVAALPLAEFAGVRAGGAVLIRGMFSGVSPLLAPRLKRLSSQHGLAPADSSWLRCPGTAISYPAIHASEGMENRNIIRQRCCSLPPVFSAALLGFAHGANVVATRSDQLAAIVHASEIWRARPGPLPRCGLMVTGACESLWSLFSLVRSAMDIPALVGPDHQANRECDA